LNQLTPLAGLHWGAPIGVPMGLLAVPICVAQQSRFPAEFLCNITLSRKLLDADKPQLTPDRRVPRLQLIPPQVAKASVAS
jgi:hypothetical protein